MVCLGYKESSDEKGAIKAGIYTRIHDEATYLALCFANKIRTCLVEKFDENEQEITGTY
jgi:hypothetical protein